jgi:hypothetical protein
MDIELTNNKKSPLQTSFIINCPPILVRVTTYKFPVKLGLPDVKPKSSIESQGEIESISCIQEIREII